MSASTYFENTSERSSKCKAFFRHIKQKAIRNKEKNSIKAEYLSFLIYEEEDKEELIRQLNDSALEEFCMAEAYEDDYYRKVMGEYMNYDDSYDFYDFNEIEELLNRH